MPSPSAIPEPSWECRSFRPIATSQARPTQKPIHFLCQAPGASQVCLTGDFNHWHRLVRRWSAVPTVPGGSQSPWDGSPTTTNSLWTVTPSNDARDPRNLPKFRRPGFASLSGQLGWLRRVGGPSPRDPRNGDDLPPIPLCARKKVRSSPADSRSGRPRCSAAVIERNCRRFIAPPGGALPPSGAPKTTRANRQCERARAHGTGVPWSVRTACNPTILVACSLLRHGPGPASRHGPWRPSKSST